MDTLKASDVFEACLVKGYYAATRARSRTGTGYMCNALDDWRADHGEVTSAYWAARAAIRHLVRDRIMTPYAMTSRDSLRQWLQVADKAEYQETYRAAFYEGLTAENAYLTQVYVWLVFDLKRRGL